MMTSTSHLCGAFTSGRITCLKTKKRMTKKHKIPKVGTSHVQGMHAMRDVTCSGDTMGISSREISPRRSPTTAGTSKSASIRKLESEGGLQQTEFFDRSQFKEDVSFMCLATIKKMEVNGAFDEAQSELEQIVHKSIAPLQRGMACLLLAELFNKWGAASATYTIGIMERGFSILLLSIFQPRFLFLSLCVLRVYSIGLKRSR